MKVLLRDFKTSLYFGYDETWVEKLEQAATFATAEEAAARSRKAGGEDVVVLLRFENPERELALNPAYCERSVPAWTQRLAA
jgi:hypothetical protein